MARRYGQWVISTWYRGDGKERKFRERTVQCNVCKGTGGGPGCHEQGGIIFGLCPECCGHGQWLSNDEPIPGSRWRSTKRARAIVDNYPGPGKLAKGSRYRPGAKE